MLGSVVMEKSDGLIDLPKGSLVTENMGSHLVKADANELREAISVSFGAFKEALVNDKLNYCVKEFQIKNEHLFQEAGEFTSERCYYQTVANGKLLATSDELGISVQYFWRAYASGDTVGESLKLKQPEVDYDRGFIFSNSNFCNHLGELIETKCFDYDMRVLAKKHQPGMGVVEVKLIPHVQNIADLAIQTSHRKPLTDCGLSNDPF